jgi:hypothetical protein
LGFETFSARLYPMRYYIRKPGSNDFGGPFTLAEIRQEVVAQRAGVQWEAIAAAGQTYRQLVKATGWVSLHPLIGEADPSGPDPSLPTPKPATPAGWLGTGLGCLALVCGCCFAMFAGIAYGVGHANDQGQAVFNLALYGAPVVTVILGISWITFRHRGSK